MLSATHAVLQVRIIPQDGARNALSSFSGEITQFFPSFSAHSRNPEVITQTLKSLPILDRMPTPFIEILANQMSIWCIAPGQTMSGKLYARHP